MKKLIITGNAGRDPEVRTDANGNVFTTFSVGVSVGTKQEPKTDWIDVHASGALAERVNNYVKRGTKVLIEGFPTTSAYINKDNHPASSLRLYARNLELLSGKRGESDENEVYALPNSGNTSVESLEDEVIF